jgi:hypothetical protein
MSFLTALGGDIKKVFSWLASSKGQSVISTGETIIESVFPGATGIVSIVNTWIAEAFKVEGLAVGAAESEGTGAQKAAIVLNTVTPQILAIAKANGLPTPTAAIIASVNDDIVGIINKLAGTTAVGTPPPPVGPVAA